MKKWLIVFVSAMTFVSCSNKSSQKKFEVNGTISNNTAKMIYLEEIPMVTMQRIVVDSAALGKDGRYVLKADSKEAIVYNLRLDQNAYPFASVINDVPKITVDAKFNKENNQFAESYDVKGSVASKEMKDFMYDFNNKLQAIFYNNRNADSLQKAGVPDSVLIVLQNERTGIAAETKRLSLQFINKSGNPALTIFELGYYQSTAGNPAFKLEALTNEEVTNIINNAAVKFPDHSGVAAVKRSLEAKMKEMQGLVGQPAPEISLPDINGKEVKLSSFRGKYVLVDFWASWCGPCRNENPNVVKAYNKYKDKNFTVLGVSLDEEKDDWGKAIQKDGLTWTHVSDLKHWNSVVVPLYHIEGIPYNVLVDPNGTVIAENLRGPMLEAKLEEAVK
jgi:peroxiredoxin